MREHPVVVGARLIFFSALPIWEYLITIDQEVSLVWGRKTRFSLQSILLVSTRICMVVSAILSAIDPESTCTVRRLFFLHLKLSDDLFSFNISVGVCLRITLTLNEAYDLISCRLEAFNIIQGIMDSFGFIQTGREYNHTMYDLSLS